MDRQVAHLSGLPHLPGVPHPHANRPLVPVTGFHCTHSLSIIWRAVYYGQVNITVTPFKWYTYCAMGWLSLTLANDLDYILSLHSIVCLSYQGSCLDSPRGSSHANLPVSSIERQFAFDCQEKQENNFRIAKKTLRYPNLWK